MNAAEEREAAYHRHASLRRRAREKAMDKKMGRERLIAEGRSIRDEDAAEEPKPKRDRSFRPGCPIGRRLAAHIPARYDDDARRLDAEGLRRRGG